MKRRLQGFATVCLVSALGLLPAAARADDDPKIKIGVKAEAIPVHDSARNFTAIGVRSAFDTWSRTGGPSSLPALAPIDATIRGHLKIPADRGLLVLHVPPQSPSWEAGIRDQDILLTLGDSPLANPGDLNKKLKEAGEKPLPLTLLRGGEKKTIQVQPRVEIGLGPIPSEQPVYKIGVVTTPVAPPLRTQLKLPEGQGLTIRDIDIEGPAGKEKIAVGDILLKLDGKPVDREQTLFGLVQTSEGKPISLELIHEGERKSVTVTPAQQDKYLTLHFEQANSPGTAATSHPQPGYRIVTRDGKPALEKTPFTVTFEPMVTMPLATSPLTGQTVASLPAKTIDVKNVEPSLGAYYRALTVAGKPAAPDPVAKRLDELSAQIDAMRKSVEVLAKAIKDKK